MAQTEWLVIANSGSPENFRLSQSPCVWAVPYGHQSARSLKGRSVPERIDPGPGCGRYSPPSAGRCNGMQRRKYGWCLYPKASGQTLKNLARFLQYIDIQCIPISIGYRYTDGYLLDIFILGYR